MRKFRNWRSGMRQKRSRTQKQKEEALLDLMAKQSNQQKPAESVLSIFLNDFTDADNEAAAVLWAWAMAPRPDIKAIYIAEPRHVNLGYYMNSKDFGRCIGLVAKLQPPVPGGDPPLTIVLGGRMTRDVIDNPDLTVDGKPLTEADRDLLERCIAPKFGEKEDAIKHARLVAMDYLTTMKDRYDRPLECYVDIACLPDLESPINLKTHYHDELIARNAEELEKFQEITRLPTKNERDVEDRRDKLREWYDKALARKRSEFETENPVKDLLDYDALFDDIRKHDKTVILGGASLTLLQQILIKEPALAKKIHYYQQGGTFNSKLNILGNPLNFALNTKAAEYVFHEDQKGKVGKLVLISTDTTKQVEFTAKGLAKFHPAVGIRAMGFFGRLDPWDLISPKERDAVSATSKEYIAWRAEWAEHSEYADPKFKGYKAVMADLVAFLICFTDAFDEYKTPHGTVRKSITKVAMTHVPGNTPERNSMVLKEDPTGTIESMMLEITDLPDGQASVLIDDTLGLAEKTMPSFRIP